MPRRVFIFLKKTGNSVSYLPHRQLRNNSEREMMGLFRYLPHRQLRKKAVKQKINRDCYLPHRQLRKY